MYLLKSKSKKSFVTVYFVSNTFKATYILFIKSISAHTKINPHVTELRGHINETLAKIYFCNIYTENITLYCNAKITPHSYSTRHALKWHNYVAILLLHHHPLPHHSHFLFFFHLLTFWVILQDSSSHFPHLQIHLFSTCPEPTPFPLPNGNITIIILFLNFLST